MGYLLSRSCVGAGIRGRMLAPVGFQFSPRGAVDGSRGVKPSAVSVLCEPPLQGSQIKCVGDVA